MVLPIGFLFDPAGPKTREEYGRHHGRPRPRGILRRQCAHCHQTSPDSPLPCPGCSVTLYCSSEHQKANHDRHATLCSVVQKCRSGYKDIVQITGAEVPPARNLLDTLPAAQASLWREHGTQQGRAMLELAKALRAMDTADSIRECLGLYDKMKTFTAPQSLLFGCLESQGLLLMLRIGQDQQCWACLKKMAPTWPPDVGVFQDAGPAWRRSAGFMRDTNPTRMFAALLLQLRLLQDVCELIRIRTWSNTHRQPARATVASHLCLGLEGTCVHQLAPLDRNLVRNVWVISLRLFRMLGADPRRQLGLRSGAPPDRHPSDLWIKQFDGFHAAAMRDAFVHAESIPELFEEARTYAHRDLDKEIDAVITWAAEPDGVAAAAAVHHCRAVEVMAVRVLKQRAQATDLRAAAMHKISVFRSWAYLSFTARRRSGLTVDPGTLARQVLDVWEKCIGWLWQ